MWIFAYGSLIFRPSFPFLERRPAWVRGFTRRFWQGSPDHRGTPDAPGRVATLIVEVGAHCGGCAYRLAPEEAPAVLGALDVREQAGFERHDLELFDRPGGRVFARALTYVAGPANPHFLGPLDAEAIAEWIRRRRGPRGPNADYVLGLRRALRELGVDDPHVEEIAHLLDESTRTPSSR